MEMTTTTLADGKPYDRIRAAHQANTVGDRVRIDDLSRLVEHDIEVLKTNLAECHYSRERDETWDDAWARFESAWETVRSELANGKASALPTEVASPASRAMNVSPQVVESTVTSPNALALKPLTGIMRALATAVGSRTGQIGKWAHEHGRRMQFPAAVARAWSQERFWQSLAWLKRAGGELRRGLDRAYGEFASVAHRFTSAGARHLASGWRWLIASGRKQMEILRTHEPQSNADDHGPRIDDLGRFVERAIAGPRTNPAEYDGGGRERDEAWQDARARFEGVREIASFELADAKAPIPPAELTSPACLDSGLGPQVDEPMAPLPSAPFVLKPLPWVMGALAPVISSRTMQFHYSCHHSMCIELANRLSRNQEELRGKSPLEILRWARKHAHGTELLAAASEAWNHAFFWRSLTPWQKRPGGELRHALERTFGDFANFADKFAAAGASHLGSGWLWLVANRRKELSILSTSDTDCPEARGRTCLLGIDLWEHAYYFDHQNRRREYLDAVINRRLDWEFAEQRYRLAVQNGSGARRAKSSPAVKRSASTRRGSRSSRRRASRAHLR